MACSDLVLCFLYLQHLFDALDGLKTVTDNVDALLESKQDLDIIADTWLKFQASNSLPSATKQ